MKKLAAPVQVIEVPGEGLVGLLGKQVFIFTAGYFFTGLLSGVNSDDILLENPSIVYETGPWTSAPKWADSQKLPTSSIYIKTGHIEAFFGVTSK